MAETLIAAALFATLLIVARGADFVRWSVLLQAGALLTALSLLVGVAAGLAYHVALRRALAPRGLLEPRWWWRPTSLHGRLDRAGRRAVMPWFYAGAACMFLSLGGCLLMLAGIVAIPFR